MALVQVSTYVSPTVKRQWESCARQHRLTAAGFLRIVMARVLEQNLESTQPTEGEAAGADLHLRLRDHENEALWSAARHHGMNRQAYLLGLIRAHAQGLPTATDEELAALRECNRQLLHIGRNLNQIAHAANVDWRQAHDFAPHSLARLLGEVKAAHGATTALARQTLGRWTWREQDENDAAR